MFYVTQLRAQTYSRVGSWAFFPITGYGLVNPKRLTQIIWTFRKEGKEGGREEKEKERKIKEHPSSKMLKN